MLECGRGFCSSLEAMSPRRHANGGFISTAYAETMLPKWVNGYPAIINASFYDCMYSIGLDEFITSLQRFMETSTLGEFTIRLKFVEAFLAGLSQRGMLTCCQGFDRFLPFDQSIDLVGYCSASHCLGNIMMYYGQFSDAVEKAIQGLVVPVEKEFKVSRK